MSGRNLGGTGADALEVFHEGTQVEREHFAKGGAGVWTEVEAEWGEL